MTLTLILLFLVIGLIFLLVEILVTPGFVLGAVGVLFMSFGVYKTFESYGPTAGTITLVSVFVVTIFIIFLALKTGVWDRMASKGTISGKAVDEINNLVKVGEIGKTISALRPSGNAVFNGVKVEVTTAGEPIKNGENVRIARIANHKIVVETIIEE